MQLHGTSKINERGHLEIGGVDTVELAQTYGTPLYVMDEALIRQRARAFVAAFRKTGLNFQVAYASKAFCTMAMCKLAEQEGLSLDVVSDGELHTALKAGFPAERIHVHGNNKTPFEIGMGIDAGVGCFVADNFHELHLLNDIAGAKGKRVNVLFRVTPGVEAHTHEFISTGQVDSKFGFDIGSGQARKAVALATELPHLRLLGLHAHIGSQIFETEGYRMTIERMAQFAADVRNELGVEFSILNVGGGFGIRYVEGDRPLPVEAHVQAIADAVRAACARHDYPLPEVWVEPGRSLVGDAGTTLYTIGSMKDIPGVRKYVAVDGGMTDNIRPALYEAKYEAILANRAAEAPAETVSIAGRACETGDMLIWDLPLPKAEPGDLLAVFCTGAYNYSMASNYNRIRRPAVVFVMDGRADLVVRRETHEDLTRNDVIPERLRA